MGLPVLACLNEGNDLFEIINSEGLGRAFFGVDAERARFGSCGNGGRSKLRYSKSRRTVEPSPKDMYSSTKVAVKQIIAASLVAMIIDVFSSKYLNTLISEARASDRNRQHRNIHHSFDEKCQRLMNSIDLESYIAPHRHRLDPKRECLIAVRGLFAAVIFSDKGTVEKIDFFGTEKFKNLSVGLELPPEVWHTVVALTQGSVLFEVKEGPFDPKKAKEFASWAPSQPSN